MVYSSENELYGNFRINDVLVAMIKAGLSAGLVADTLGMTRSAVIGRKSRWSKDVRCKRLTLTEIFGEKEANRLLSNPRKSPSGDGDTCRRIRPKKTVYVPYVASAENSAPTMGADSDIDLDSLFADVVVFDADEKPVKAPSYRAPKPPKEAKAKAVKVPAVPKVVKPRGAPKKERTKAKAAVPIEQHDYASNPYAVETPQTTVIEVNGIMVSLFGDEHLYMRKNSNSEYDPDIEDITEQGAQGKRIFNYSKAIAPIKSRPSSIIAPDCSPVLFDELRHDHCRVIIGYNASGGFYCCGNKIAAETKKFCSYHRSYMVIITGKVNASI